MAYSPNVRLKHPLLQHVSIIPLPKKRKEKAREKNTIVLKVYDNPSKLLRVDDYRTAGVYPASIEAGLPMHIVRPSLLSTVIRTSKSSNSHYVLTRNHLKRKNNRIKSRQSKSERTKMEGHHLSRETTQPRRALATMHLGLHSSSNFRRHTRPSDHSTCIINYYLSLTNSIQRCLFISIRSVS